MRLTDQVGFCGVRFLPEAPEARETPRHTRARRYSSALSDTNHHHSQCVRVCAASKSTSTALWIAPLDPQPEFLNAGTCRHPNRLKGLANAAMA